jgi:hypothetical protein
MASVQERTYIMVKASFPIAFGLGLESLRTDGDACDLIAGRRPAWPRWQHHRPLRAARLQAHRAQARARHRGPPQAAYVFAVRGRNRR